MFCLFFWEETSAARRYHRHVDPRPLVADSLVILFAKLILFHDELLNYTFTWVDFKTVAGIGPLKLDLGIMIDNVTAIMLVVVTLISFLVHLFSTAYMSGDIRYSRYFAYLGFFSFSMLGIVITNNFFMMYVFWELVGISSYLLIGHWYEKKSASDASMKAFIVNRIGDVGMFIGINILWATFHTLTFEKIFSAISGGHIPFDSNPWLTAAGIRSSAERSENRHSSRCMSGFPTRWKVPRPSVH